MCKAATYLCTVYGSRSCPRDQSAFILAGQPAYERRNLLVVVQASLWPARVGGLFAFEMWSFSDGQEKGSGAVSTVLGKGIASQERRLDAISW